MSPRFQSLDLLASLLAVLDRNGRLVFANSAFEDALGLSRRVLLHTRLADFFEDPQALEQAIEGVNNNRFATLRYDAVLHRSPQLQREALPVQVIVAPTDQDQEVIVEMLPQELHARQEREERLAEQARTHQELIRNLAHEIKNPLGGIRGAAQLLQMELNKPEFAQYTDIIIQEADRLHSMVERLLAPHRHNSVIGDVNIHEICERVRGLMLAEFGSGLKVTRDYDASIPEFRGDREQLLQAVLNIAHNAAQAMGERIAAKDAQLGFRTRVVRQATVGGRRYRLALKLHVTDNGPGIPDSIKDRVFYPLVSGRVGGTGLGLCLAQSFVQQHHGLIEFESSPAGTDFQILIPLP